MLDKHEVSEDRIPNTRIKRVSDNNLKSGTAVYGCCFTSRDSDPGSKGFRVHESTI